MSRPEYITVSNSDLTVRLDHFQVKNSFRGFFRIAVDRLWFKFIPDSLIFYRLLGTGSGQTFTSKDADIYRWVLLTVWPNQKTAEEFAASTIYKKWERISVEYATFFLAPISSKGEWAKQKPFGEPKSHRWDGPVLSITRARIKTKMWRRFQKEVPPVSKSLHLSSGLLTTFGIGEAPIGLQGTVSVWINNRSLTEFAQREVAHREVITKTHQLNWYSEELFARFAIVSVAGSLNGVALAKVIQVD